jgi:hypothetical protein
MGGAATYESISGCYCAVTLSLLSGEIGEASVECRRGVFQMLLNAMRYEVDR